MYMHNAVNNSVISTSARELYIYTRVPLMNIRNTYNVDRVASSNVCCKRYTHVELDLTLACTWMHVRVRVCACAVTCAPVCIYMIVCVLCCMHDGPLVL